MQSCNAECNILLEQINIASRIWRTSIVLVNVLFVIPIRKINCHSFYVGKAANTFTLGFVNSAVLLQYNP